MSAEKGCWSAAAPVVVVAVVAQQLHVVRPCLLLHTSICLRLERPAGLAWKQVLMGGSGIRRSFVGGLCREARYDVLTKAHMIL